MYVEIRGKNSARNNKIYLTFWLNITYHSHGSVILKIHKHYRKYKITSLYEYS